MEYIWNMKTKCFACGKTLKGKIFYADCSDDQKNVTVGPDCFRQIMEQAEYAKERGCENPGYLPYSGGPNLFPAKNPLK